MAQPRYRYSIGSPPPAGQLSALELAYESLPAATRKQAADELRRAAAQGERSLDGLFAAWREGDMLGAVLTEIVPGESASLWPVRLAPGVPQPLAQRLLTHAIEWLQSQGVKMAQCLLARDSDKDARVLRAAGFEHACDLLCLASEADRFPTAAIASDLRFAAVAPADLDDLARVIEQTYEGSLDCPAVDALRDCRQVVAGYAATCRGDLSHWFIALHAENPVGCLLLGHESTGKTWEVVYMGLTPAVRGRGWGLDVVRHAQWLVREQRGERLLLAVDAANDPAVRVYAAAGFITWDRKSVFIKTL